MPKYLITGVAGFIGSQVAEQLLAADHEVVGVDNLNSAYDPQLKQWRLSRLQRQSAFAFQELDIADRGAWERFSTKFADEPFAAVFNLAARAGVRPSVQDPWVYQDTNVTGTLNVLELCRRQGVKKFVLASTSSLYGGANPVPFAEDANTNYPLSPYAASKKGAEALTYTYHHLHGIDVTVFRYFTVYGPAGRPDMSVFRFIRQIAEGEPLDVFGDGTQERDFTYVEDIARGTIAGLQPTGYDVFNLGGDRPVPLNFIIDKISGLLGKKPLIRRLPGHPADVPATWANIDKARSMLNWSPTVSVEEGLARCVEWYRRERNWLLNIRLDMDRAPARKMPRAA